MLKSDKKKYFSSWIINYEYEMINFLRARIDFDFWIYLEIFNFFKLDICMKVMKGSTKISVHTKNIIYQFNWIEILNLMWQTVTVLQCMILNFHAFIFIFCRQNACCSSDVCAYHLIRRTSMFRTVWLFIFFQLVPCGLDRCKDICRLLQLQQKFIRSRVETMYIHIRSLLPFSWAPPGPIELRSCVSHPRWRQACHPARMGSNWLMKPLGKGCCRTSGTFSLWYLRVDRTR